MKRILVTGCGSLIGQGIIRTLKASTKKYIIFGTDYINDSVGLFWVKKGFILPDILKNKNKSLWIKKILKIITKNKINYLIPGLDFELEYLSKNKNLIEKETGCKVIISDSKIIKNFNDKWLTVKYLKENKFHYPKSCLPQTLNQFLKTNKFPLIVKPRIGSTSKNVFTVNNLKELRQAIKKCPRPIIQEYLFKNNNEYTCGCLYNLSKKVFLNSISLNRKLKNGNTIIATHKKNAIFHAINKYLTKVTKFVKPNGPINYQLCFTKKKPIIFEINPRFSGTTPLRNNFGVNEIDILIDSLEGRKIKKTKVKTGTIFRYFEDYFAPRKKIN